MQACGRRGSDFAIGEVSPGAQPHIGPFTTHTQPPDGVETDGGETGGGETGP